jgi:hypothetical protein
MAEIKHAESQKVIQNCIFTPFRPDKNHFKAGLISFFVLE